MMHCILITHARILPGSLLQPHKLINKNEMQKQQKSERIKKKKNGQFKFQVSVEKKLSPHSATDYD